MRHTCRIQFWDRKQNNVNDYIKGQSFKNIVSEAHSSRLMGTFPKQVRGKDLNKKGQ